MSYCPNCGTQLLVGSKFCQNCGTPIAAAVYNAAPIYDTPVYSNVDTSRKDYRIIMVRRDTCSKANARELLMDIFGYSAAEANLILDSLPAEIACNLTFQQAVYASQALTEYGIDVSVINSDGYTNINQYASSSVYNNNGSFLNSVLSVLGTLTVANRLNKLTQWNRPLSYTFRPNYRRTDPLAYQRHYIRKPAPVLPNRSNIAVPRRDEPLRNAIGPLKPSSPSSNSNSKANTPISHGLHADPNGGKKGGGNGPLGPGPSGPLGPDRRR
ncbi:MAG: zinc ribbon domain-containing protein [Clostridia bacterium]|nr:zinc ribbon domain-containing protein [Clostridia bacterium]